MRSSERLAAGFVFVVVALSLVPFPALGFWYVTKAWPSMSLPDRILFCSAVVALPFGLVCTCRHWVERGGEGNQRRTGLVENLSLLLPCSVGEWALLHRSDGLLLVLVSIAWDVVDRLRQRNRASSLHLSEKVPTEILRIGRRLPPFT